MKMISDSTTRVSIVVTCKGRLHHLRQCLPTMRNQQCSFNYEIVVVDYGCPQDTFAWCKSLDLEHLVSVRVNDHTQLFNLSRARNCGTTVARGAILAFVDADMRVDSTFLEEASKPISSGRAGLVTVARPINMKCWDLTGTCLIESKLFHQVRGYDEGFEGWGPDDFDFYDRCTQNSANAKYPPGLVTPIPHGNRERSQFYAEKSIAASNLANLRYPQKRTHLVNKDGYGTGDFDIHRGSRIPIAMHNPIRRRLVRSVRRSEKTMLV